MDGWETLMSMYTPQMESASSGQVSRDYVVNGLVRRGLPQHVAEGFAMNMADESGLDAGVNERNPSVKGSRGGFGLYQLTGSRRRAYEAYANARGVDYSNPDAQMDFLVDELNGSEAGAAKAIFNTRTAGEAGAAIVNDFLRPAKAYRDARAAKYLASDQPPQYNRFWLDIGA